MDEHFDRPVVPLRDLSEVFGGLAFSGKRPDMP
jgi:hypothetical protein